MPGVKKIALVEEDGQELTSGELNHAIMHVEFDDGAASRGRTFRTCS